MASEFFLFLNVFVDKPVEVLMLVEDSAIVIAIDFHLNTQTKRTQPERIYWEKSYLQIDYGNANYILQFVFTCNHICSDEWINTHNIQNLTIIIL